MIQSILSLLFPLQYPDLHKTYKRYQCQWYTIHHDKLPMALEMRDGNLEFISMSEAKSINRALEGV